jgi:hypothetical protein
MNEFFLLGEKLPIPKLRFHPSSLQAQHEDARQGLKRYGPYDALSLGKERIRCILIYPQQLAKEQQILVSGLTKGYNSFPGFQSLFRIPIDFVSERPISSEEDREYKRAIEIAMGRDKPDLVMMIMRDRNQHIYTMAKSLLLGNGIPSQMVTAEKIRNLKGLPWTLENIALQVYAKIGGTPWTVMSPDQRRELVIGVSRTTDKRRNFVVGFITLFTHDGDYQFLYSLAPKPVEWKKLDEYRDALTGLIVEAWREFERRQGKPSSVVIHLCKRPGKFREIAAVEKALEKMGRDLPYALLHLNDDTNYRLFDASHLSYVPQSGIKVEIDSYTALLFLDGRVPDRTGQEVRRKRGVPRLLEVRMDKRSTMPTSEFPRLVEQVFAFARINWRGFNAQAIPATLNYSHLVARIVSEIGAEDWNHIASAVTLRDKAWFL